MVCYVCLNLLGRSCLHLSLGILILVGKMLLDGADMGYVQNIKSVVIPGSAHLENQLNAAVA